MSAVASTMERILAKALPPADGAALLQGDVSEHRAHAARRAIAEAREQLKAAIRAHDEAKRSLGTAQTHLERARQEIAGVEPAVERARIARAADEKFRRSALERGEPGVDRELAVAADRSLADVREARRASRAARDALPALEGRVKEADEHVKVASDRIDAAIGDVLIATVALRTLEAHELAARLNRQLAELAGLAHLFEFRGVFQSALGTVPDELVPRVHMQFDRSELTAHTAVWKQYANRLREDPDAEFSESDPEVPDVRLV